jgi:predicted DNA-binding transcriptional regulator YafY
MSSASPLLRQWKLLMTLAGCEAGLGVYELSREYAVTDKTVRRDLILLRRAGFPLEEAVGPRGRKLWKIAAAELPLALNWQEAMSLYLARRFLDPLAGTYFTKAADSAFAKVRAGLGPQALKYLDRMAGAVHLTNLGNGQYASKAAFLDQLELAIEECRVTWLTYQSEQTTEPATREVHPYTWIFHRGSVYLAAFATERREVRLYKADRIHGVDVTPMRFPKPVDFDPTEYLAGSFGVYRGSNGQPVQIRVRFLSPVVEYVAERRWHPSQTLARQADGSVIAEFTLSATEEIKRWLLSFGRNAEVLRPASLVAELHEETAALMGLYGLEPPRRTPRVRRAR